MKNPLFFRELSSWVWSSWPLLKIGFVAIAIGVVSGFCLAKARLKIDDTQILNIEEPKAIHPNPRWPPEEVVRRQMAALKSAVSNDDAFASCYALASPANRATVGPIESFQKLLISNYSDMIGHREAVVGRASIEQDFAHVLVTGFSAEGKALCYQFFLAKQRTPPYEGCWMTDSVFRYQAVNPPQAKGRSLLNDPRIQVAYVESSK
jgi:hypothetical protein